MTVVAIKTEETTPLEPLKEYRQQLATIKAANASFVFDYNDKKQLKAAKSHIDKLRTTKASIEKAGKAAREGYIVAQKKVIEEEKSLVAEVVEMIELHHKPLKEWEAQEEARIQAIRDRIAGMAIAAEWVINKTAAELSARLDEISAVDVDDCESWGDLGEAAQATKLSSIEYLQVAITMAEKREAEALELEQLRAANAAREEADRLAAEKLAAEVAAKEKADRQAAEELELQERARKIAEAEATRIAEAEEAAREAERIRQEQEAARIAKEAADREQKLKDDAAEAARRHQAELDQAKADKEAATAKAIKDAEEAQARQDAAVAAERQRIEREAADKAAEEAKRRADRDHRGKIHSEIVEAMARSSGITPEQAKAVVIAICGDQVPHLTIKY